MVTGPKRWIEFGEAEFDHAGGKRDSRPVDFHFCFLPLFKGDPKVRLAFSEVQAGCHLKPSFKPGRSV